MLVSFAFIAVIMTLVGGLFPFIGSLFSRPGISRLFYLRAGILLCVAFTEILPEAWSLHHILAGWGALAAFVGLFAMGNFAMTDSCPEYLEQCSVHYLGWTALFALTIHSFIDGFNLAVSFSAGERAGLAVGLALALHKIADGFTLTSLFSQGGYSPSRSRLALIGVATATPLGVILSSQGNFAGLPSSVEAALMGFAAGSFIYIAASDILPRIHRNKDRVGLVYFGLGMLAMAALRIL